VERARVGFLMGSTMARMSWVETWVEVKGHTGSSSSTSTWRQRISGLRPSISDSCNHKVGEGHVTSFEATIDASNRGKIKCHGCEAMVLDLHEIYIERNEGGWGGVLRRGRGDGPTSPLPWGAP